MQRDSRACVLLTRLSSTQRADRSVLHAHPCAMQNPRLTVAVLMHSIQYLWMHVVPAFSHAQPESPAFLLVLHQAYQAFPFVFHLNLHVCMWHASPCLVPIQGSFCVCRDWGDNTRQCLRDGCRSKYLVATLAGRWTFPLPVSIHADALLSQLSTQRCDGRPTELGPAPCISTASLRNRWCLVRQTGLSLCCRQASGNFF